MRVVKPETGTFGKASVAIMNSGDGAVYPVVGGFATMGSIIGGIITTIAAGPEFAFIFLPALFYLLTLVGYNVGTAQMYSDASQIYRRVIYDHRPKLQGTPVEELAKPLMIQVYKCSKEGHPTKQYGKHCGLCLEREKLLKELIPNKPTDRSDIDVVKRYLESKKEADALHSAALKELTS